GINIFVSTRPPDSKVVASRVGEGVGSVCASAVVANKLRTMRRCLVSMRYIVAVVKVRKLLFRLSSKDVESRSAVGAIANRRIRKNECRARSDQRSRIA